MAASLSKQTELRNFLEKSSDHCPTKYCAKFLRGEECQAFAAVDPASKLPLSDSLPVERLATEVQRKPKPSGSKPYTLCSHCFAASNRLRSHKHYHESDGKVRKRAYYRRTRRTGATRAARADSEAQQGLGAHLPAKEVAVDQLLPNDTGLQGSTVLDSDLHLAVGLCSLLGTPDISAAIKILHDWSGVPDVETTSADFYCKACNCRIVVGRTRLQPGGRYLRPDAECVCSACAARTTLSDEWVPLRLCSRTSLAAAIQWLGRYQSSACHPPAVQDCIKEPHAEYSQVRGTSGEAILALSPCAALRHLSKAAMENAIVLPKLTARGFQDSSQQSARVMQTVVKCLRGGKLWTRAGKGNAAIFNSELAAFSTAEVYLQVNLDIDPASGTEDDEVAAVYARVLDDAARQGLQSEGVRGQRDPSVFVLVLLGPAKTGTAFHIDRGSAVNTAYVSREDQGAGPVAKWTFIHPLACGDAFDWLEAGPWSVQGQGNCLVSAQDMSLLDVHPSEKSE